MSTSLGFTYTVTNANATIIGNYIAQDGYFINNWNITNIPKNNITTLRFTNDLQYITGMNEYSGNFGTNIICYSDGYDVVFYSAHNIYAPANCSGLLSGLSSCTNIYFDNFVTNNVVDMSNMFSSDSALTALDIAGFDTVNVVNMSEMFRECSHLSNLNFGNINTSSVTDMSGMFG